ncbi:MAG TPA: ketoacyl-ACP synthase III [Desulfobacteraceae bacterium]|nr:ketoacyl-ACP synthase III [Desulfobacteraceae bacterium]
MPTSHITGTGSSIPKRVLSNKELEQIVETSDEWIIRRSGIKERRISHNGRNETATDLATEASNKALTMAGVTPDELDLIVAGTVTPDRQFPSTACMVQNNIRAANAAAYDLSAGCTGFLFALKTVDDSIRAGTCRNALVIGVERLSSILNWRDRGTCVLMGDGAGAVVVSAKDEPGGVLSTHIRSDGTFWELLHTEWGNTYIPDTLDGVDIKPFYMIMEGNKVFKIAVERMSDIAGKALIHNKFTGDDIALVVPHQANIRIIQALARSLGLSMDKVFTNIQKYGNTSSATIPIALDEAYRGGRVDKSDNILMVSFGAGLTWASSVVRWSMDRFNARKGV